MREELQIDRQVCVISAVMQILVCCGKERAEQKCEVSSLPKFTCGHELCSDRKKTITDTSSRINFPHRETGLSFRPKIMTDATTCLEGLISLCSSTFYTSFPGLFAFLCDILQKTVNDLFVIATPIYKAGIVY